MDFGDLSDNPFSLDLNPTPQPKRRSLVAAAKFLVFVAVCLAITVVVGSQSRKWLLGRLTQDFDTLTVDQKQSRLSQIAEFGEPAIEPLVTALADDDTEVARYAYEILRESQNQWTVLGRSELEQRHESMIESLRSIAVQMPDDRTGWGTSLLQQTLMTTIDREDDQSRELYEKANRVMELLALSDRAGPSILSETAYDTTIPQRLTPRSQPLPVSSVENAGQWVDWPPPQRSAPPTPLPFTVEPTEPATSEEPTSVAEAPSVYRSSSTKLRAVQPDEPVVLREITPTQDAAHESAEIRSVTHLVDSPLETFDDRSVIHWLGSPHQVLREKAKLELIARGYDGTQLAIATQIAAGDTKTRMELVDAIARADSIDPRPWLLMMLEDESRDVKLRVVSVLATMNDPGVSQRLRMHLVDEQDPTVAARIRRVLDLR